MAAQLTPEQIEKWREKAMKLQPTPNGSVYMKPQDMEWAPSQFPGIQIKVLYKNEAEGEMTCLLKWQPGARLPFHMHPEIEQTWVDQLERGKQLGQFRADLDARLIYRLLRDILWIPTSWKQARGKGWSTDEIVDGLLRLLFDGITAPGQ